VSGYRKKVESDKRCLDVRNQVDALLKPLSYEERMSILVSASAWWLRPRWWEKYGFAPAAKKDGGA